jgi:hypothetical protein
MFGGRYSFHGEQNFQAGLLDIENGVINKGHIMDLARDSPPRYEVEDGRILRSDGVIRLTFTKVPGVASKPNAFYTFEKTDNGRLEGHYFGAWSFRDQPVVRTVMKPEAGGQFSFPKKPEGEMSNSAILILNALNLDNLVLDKLV